MLRRSDVLTPNGLLASLGIKMPCCEMSRSEFPYMVQKSR